jgi:hypothetical protein
MPYIGDAALAATMASRLNDFRGVIFRFERMLTGRMHPETVYYGMLQLRRQLIEQHLEAYSKTHFHRWTLELLRAHYNPRTGHRFSYLRVLDAEIADLERVRGWIMEHAMFVHHPDLGERTFNLRAVDQRLRTSRALLDVYKAKVAALHTNVGDIPATAVAVMDAIGAASTMLATAGRKRARDTSTDESVANLYELGGL